jgi:hypothetical protein
MKRLCSAAAPTFAASAAEDSFHPMDRGTCALVEKS